jgi:fluoroquinolone transport system ATP-binding protein
MIQVDNLTYRYPGADGPAVSGVSFGVSPGEIFGLLGPSGAGKSTTQRVLTRQNRRFGGTVEVLSRALGTWDHGLYQHIGVDFETPCHYLTLTGRENLEFFASLYPGPTREPSELLELVGLEGEAEKRVGEYSKGMQRRLNFARALLHDPAVLFLDEPTAGLDPVHAGMVKSLVRDQRERGKTILLTTHNMVDVDELCDRVGFLVEGRMSLVDDPDALKTRYGRRSVRVGYSRGSGSLEFEEFPLDGLAQDHRFLQILDTFPIRSLHSQEASLDRVFADVTGVQLASQ